MRKGIIYVYFNRAKYEKEGIERYYVGQTIRTMEQRAGKDGRGYGWQDEKYQTKFARAIRKWGWEAFEGKVLEEVYEEDLNELEKFYIKEFDSYKHGYNDTFGGEGTRGNNPYKNKNEEEMKEIGKKISESKKGENNPMYGVHRCGKDSPMYGRTGENSPMYGRQHSEETKKKQSESKKGENNPMYGITGENSPVAKSVYCNELKIYFSHIKLAENYCVNILNIKIGPINRVCNGKRNFTGKLADGTKLTWKWKEDVDKEILDKSEYIDSKKYEEILSQNVNVCNK